MSYPFLDGHTAEAESSPPAGPERSGVGAERLDELVSEDYHDHPTWLKDIVATQTQAVRTAIPNRHTKDSMSVSQVSLCLVCHEYRD